MMRSDGTDAYPVIDLHCSRCRISREIKIIVRDGRLDGPLPRGWIVNEYKIICSACRTTAAPKPKPASVRGPTKLLSFTFDHSSNEWHSNEGGYTVWLQGRPRHDLPEWAAMVSKRGMGNTRIEEWLTKTSPSRLHAFETCEEHWLEIPMKTVIDCTKQVTRPKVTIARDEMRVKIPPHVESAMAERIIAFCEVVKAAEQPLFHQTLRGQISTNEDGKLTTTLLRDNKTAVRSYREGIAIGERP